MRMIVECVRCGIYRLCDNATGVWICYRCAKKEPKG